MSILYDMRSGTLVKSKLYSNGLLLENLLSIDKAIKELFAGGKQGIWLDPSDLSTMFKDAAGTQPVTADGDPVGLILDKSKGEVLVPKDITSVDAVNGLESSATYSKETKVLSIAGTSTSRGFPRLHASVDGMLYKDRLYKVVIELTGDLADFRFVLVQINGSSSVSTASYSASDSTGKLTVYLKQTVDYDRITLNFDGTTQGEVKLEKLEVYEVSGNHATQTVSASRPTYKTDGISHWLEFDGVDDHLKTNYIPTTAWTASAAITVTLARTSMVFEGYSTVGKSPNMYIQSDGRVTVWNMLAGEFNVTNPTYILNTPNVHSVTSSVSNIATVPVTVGARSTETTKSFFFEGRLFGLVIVNGVEQMDAVNSSLKVKEGIV